MDKTLKNIKSYEEVNNRTINEGVIKVNDVFKVKAIIDVPVSLVNAFIRKVKTEKGPDVLDQWSNTDLAEAILQFITNKYLNIDSLPSSLITGEDEGKAAQPQPGVQPTVQPAVQPNVQPTDVQPDANAQVQQDLDSMEPTVISSQPGNNLPPATIETA